MSKLKDLVQLSLCKENTSLTAKANLETHVLCCIQTNISIVHRYRHVKYSSNKIMNRKIHFYEFDKFSFNKYSKNCPPLSTKRIVGFSSNLSMDFLKAVKLVARSI